MSERPGYRLEAEIGTSSVVCPACCARFLIRSRCYWETAIPKAGGFMEPRRHRATRVFCSNKCRQKAYRARKHGEGLQTVTPTAGA